SPSMRDSIDMNMAPWIETLAPPSSLLGHVGAAEQETTGLRERWRGPTTCGSMVERHQSRLARRARSRWQAQRNCAQRTGPSSTRPGAHDGEYHGARTQAAFFQFLLS